MSPLSSTRRSKSPMSPVPRCRVDTPAELSFFPWLVESPKDCNFGGAGFAQKHLDDDIHLAAAQKSVSLLSIAMLQRHTCNEERTLFEAVRWEKLEAVKLLLEHRPKDADLNCGGQRPLHCAIEVCCAAGDTGFEMAKALLENGATPNAARDDDPILEAPLHLAARRGSCAAVELLLAHGANPSAVDATGCSALHVICRHASLHSDICSKKLLSLMLQHGANPCQQDMFGHAPERYLFTGSELLLQMLEGAKQHWHRRSLRLLGGNVSDDPRTADASGFRIGCAKVSGWKALFPELQEDVISFL